MSPLSGLSLYLLTFNCGRALIKPEIFASHLFDGMSNTGSIADPPALIVLHLQEISPLAVGFNSYFLTPYFDHFRSAVRLAVKQHFPEVASQYGTDASSGAYVNCATGHAGITAIMLFVRADLQDRIADVLSAEVGVGVQKMGNKGAAGLRIAWRLPGPSNTDTMNLTFISAHLAPFEEAVERRNQDFCDIAAGLVFERQTGLKFNPQKQNTSSEDEPLLAALPEDRDESATAASRIIGMYAPDAHVFFSGDLNYRTSSTRPVHDGSDTKSFPQPVSSASNPRHYLNFLPRDQLTKQLHAGNTLHGFTESPVTFPPTYKYSDSACADREIMLDSEVTEWKWASHRWPSWCDRILHSMSSPNSSTSQVTVHKYTALPLFATSDHRPVALSASIPLRAVVNNEFAGHRPVEIDRNWKANRDSAKFKEAVVGLVLGSVSTTDGLMNLTMGVAAVVCFAVLATVYAREW